MKCLRLITNSLVRLVRLLKADEWPLVGPVIRGSGRFWNQWVQAEGVTACIDGRIRLTLSPKAFSGGNYGFDPKLTEELKRLAVPGRHFLDAGAHMGICSLLYSELAGPQTRVAAFDPNPNVFPLLFENVRVSGKPVQLLQSALGDRVGEVSFYVNGRDPNASLSAEAPGKYWFWKDKEKPVMTEYRVPITTIDAFSAAFGFDPGLLKLDVEGAEYPVLKGAQETIRRCRPIILLETHVFAWESFGYKGEDLERWIREARYEIFDEKDQSFHGVLGTGPMQDNNHYTLRPL